MSLRGSSTELKHFAGFFLMLHSHFRIDFILKSTFLLLHYASFNYWLPAGMKFQRFYISSFGFLSVKMFTIFLRIIKIPSKMSPICV